MHQKLLTYICDAIDRDPPRVAIAAIAAAVLLLAVVTCAVAGTATVSWTLPVQNTDGSPIASSGSGALASSRVEWGTCSGTAFGTKAGEVVVAVPVTSTTVNNLADGSTVCFRVYARNQGGNESGPSAVALKAIPVPTPTPSPPVLVTVSTAAYDVVKKGGLWQLGRLVGTVPLGRACGTFAVKSYRDIPNSSVTFSRTPRSGAVVAQCATAS